MAWHPQQLSPLGPLQGWQAWHGLNCDGGSPRVTKLSEGKAVILKVLRGEEGREVMGGEAWGTKPLEQQVHGA